MVTVMIMRLLRAFSSYLKESVLSGKYIQTEPKLDEMYLTTLRCSVFYNSKRRHSSNDQLSPVEYEKRFEKTATECLVN